MKISIQFGTKNQSSRKDKIKMKFFRFAKKL